MSEPIDRKPDDFNWVNARAGCSTSTIFEKLKMFVENDVEEMNKLRKSDYDTSFTFIPSQSTRFAVKATDEKQFHRNVSFTLHLSEIVITGQDGNSFTVTVGLSDDGDCRCRVSGQEYDLWQIRKKALEELFFKNFQVN